ncbi:MAG: hypothetical protein VX278_09830, partial [Myxococcota bacterium]|nr:hypothetical protein [Myxococcota bacterium]
VHRGRIKSIDTSHFLVMTRESTLQILKNLDKNPSCIAGECEVEIACNIGADSIISCDITVYTNTHIITLKLHDSYSSALRATDQIKHTDPLAFLEEMPSLGERLAMEGQRISDNATKTKGLNESSRWAQTDEWI